MLLQKTLSESRMGESRTSGSMSGGGNGPWARLGERGNESEPLAAGADKPERNRASRRLYSFSSRGRADPGSWNRPECVCYADAARSNPFHAARWCRWAMGDGMEEQLRRDNRIAVLGGCGHVGLPLACMFASKGCEVTIVDVDSAAVERVRRGEVGFMERGTEELLRLHIGKNLKATTDASRVGDAEVVICVVGTRVDEHLNPRLNSLLAVISSLEPHLRAEQLFVLRSTVYPGATDFLSRWFDEHVPGIDLAFCPERVAQGFAIQEIRDLPQIVSGTSSRACERAAALFSRLSAEIVRLEPLEAELAKLFCNSWRYITFAVANQFYSLCAKNGLDYYRIHSAITKGYPRMKHLPGAGFAAGPCLFKDTMQLAAYYDNEFSIGQNAMLVNEGFPRVLMQQLRRLGLRDKTVGLLGMAFKADNDDVRDSLSFKMKKLLELECRRVLCTDEFVRAPGLLDLEAVIAQADVLVIGVPHSRYKTIETQKPVLDPWNLLGRGGLLR
jgi:UDP-N-acetyl-D-mannosaminuronic acid dehydrogenase